MKKLEELKFLLTSVFVINQTNGHKDGDISSILDYAFRRFYGANTNAGFVFRYSDSDGNYATRSYMFYTFREALRRFRKEFGLEHKPTTLVDLYKEPLVCSMRSKQ